MAFVPRAIKVAFGFCDESVVVDLPKFVATDSSAFSRIVRVSSLCSFFAELLEARITSERIEHRIELEECRRERHACGHAAIARYRKYFL